MRQLITVLTVIIASNVFIDVEQMGWRGIVMHYVIAISIFCWQNASYRADREKKRREWNLTS